MDDKEKNKKEIEELVLRAQEGDEKAFADIYKFFINPLYRFVFFKAEKDDVEDILANIFVKAWKNIHSYKNTENYFSAWIYRIAANTVIDHYRQHRKIESLKESKTIADESRDKNPVRITENKINRIWLEKAIKILESPYKEIIIFKFIEDLSNEEIAQITGKSMINIRVLQYRALKKIKFILEKIGFN